MEGWVRSPNGMFWDLAIGGLWLCAHSGGWSVTGAQDDFGTGPIDRGEASGVGAAKLEAVRRARRIWWEALKETHGEEEAEEAPGS